MPLTKAHGKYGLRGPGRIFEQSIDIKRADTLEKHSGLKIVSPSVDVFLVIETSSLHHSS